RCNTCNHEKFSLNEGKWIGLFKYNLHPNNINKIKNNIFLLGDLEQFLKDLGFIIKPYETFMSKDHIYGPFDLVAYKGTEVFIFNILGNDLQYNLSMIFEMDFGTKVIDKEVKPFAIALFEPQEIVLKLLKKFDIIPLVKDDIKDIVKGIRKYI
ncbi:MAG: hypothetical protein M3Z01_06640, partial [Thermoproteota archaeon]|nr:hypothetical protein [Thermoproteota archaeon]